MKPAVKDFVFTVGDTPKLGVVLHGQNVRSLEIRGLPRPGQVVEWEIAWPTGTVTKTSAANGGLLVDVRTGAIFWPITVSDVGSLVGSAASYKVRLIGASGHVSTYLVGTLRAEG